MTSSLNHHRASQKRFARTFILQFLIVAIAAVAMLACTPSHAYAKSYTCPSVTIDAQANADGSLDVTEARTFDFSGNFTAVWWTFDNMPTKESMLSVKSVSLTNESTGETQTLSPVEFQRAWREAGGAGYPSYSIDEDENTVYVFFDESDSEVTMTLSYSISNFVQVYDDVAEVYWQYIGHGWAVDSDHVTTTLTVPVAAGAQVRAGDNVRAWGHGPLDGSLSIGDDGAIYAQVSSVSAGGYAEIHSVFPAEWMNVSGSAANKHMGNRLDSVLEDEAQLANKANASRLQSLLFIVVCSCSSAMAANISPNSRMNTGAMCLQRVFRPRLSGDCGVSMPSPPMTLRRRSCICPISAQFGSTPAATKRPTRGFLAWAAAKR